MDDFSQALATAFHLLIGFDGELAEIVLLSLRVSGGAVLLAALIGLPLGAAVAKRAR